MTNNGDHHPTLPPQMNINSLRQHGHVHRLGPNQRKIEMKVGLLNILYANSFARMDREKTIVHLGKFYEKQDH